MGARSSIVENIALVTPNDSEKLANSGTLYIESAGDIKITTDAGDVTVAVTDFMFFPIVVKKVFSTGTTATGIHVCY